MPVPLLIAMVLAFGLRLPTESRGLTGSEVIRRMAWAALGVVFVATIGAAFGSWIATSVKRHRQRESTSRRRYLLAIRLVVGLGLTVFAMTLSLLDWTRVVDWGLGLRDIPVLEEIAVLAPYLLGQGLAWLGLHRAERVLRHDANNTGILRDLFRAGRRTGGLVLPVAVMYVLGRDFLREGSSDDPTVAFVSLCAIAALVFVASPGFVRLAFPLRPLPPGDLRDRLERLSRRLRFRCTDILVWDTGGAIINAGVTGAIPQFRYVLLTDALIASLSYGEIEAVFAHEVGHVAHRHLPFFALFFLGSAGFLTVASAAVERFADVDLWFGKFIPDPTVSEVVKAAVVLMALGTYFFLAFGALSRRFERQADLYGARAVSCGQAVCPPHFDPNAIDSPDLPVRSVCPEGIQLFAAALQDVAILNGMSITKGSWRHGTIAQRVEFLQSLVMQPDREQRFERITTRLRWVLVIGLSAGSALVWGISRLAAAVP